MVLRIVSNMQTEIPNLTLIWNDSQRTQMGNDICDIYLHVVSSLITFIKFIWTNELVKILVIMTYRVSIKKRHASLPDHSFWSA